MKKIKCNITPKTEYNEEYFMLMLNYDNRELPLLPKSCSDCAVTCKLYIECSEALKQQSPELQLQVSKSWICHNNPNFTCRGNADNLGLTW